MTKQELTREIEILTEECCRKFSCAARARSEGNEQLAQQFRQQGEDRQRERDSLMLKLAQMS